MSHPTEELLVAYRFGDIDDRAELSSVDEHLRTCVECQASLESIDSTLAAVSRLPIPDRSEGYGAEVWARLQPKLSQRPRRWWMGVGDLLAPRRLALAGGLAAVLLAVVVAGRFWLRPAPQAPAEAPAVASTAAEVPTEQVRQDVLLVAVGDHLERSQMALVELVNTANAPSVDISAEQERARDLVVENRLYRQSAEEAGDAAVAAVLDDLERVFLEVANGPSELPQADFERVRQRIESQGIIFKVRVFGDRVRGQESRPEAGGRVEG